MISPGENISGKVTVHNTSDTPINIRVYWEDFRYEPPFDGKKQFLAAGTTSYSIANWATLSAEKFTLPGFGKRDVDYVINVPSDVRGGYYGVLFFEKSPEEVTGSHGLSIVARVGSLFFLESNDRNKDAAITDWQVEGDSLKGKFTNKGDVIAIPKGVFYVMNSEGLAVDRGEIEKLYIPPTESADFLFNLSPDLRAGKYSAVITFDLNDGDVLVKELSLIKESSGTLSIQDIKD